MKYSFLDISVQAFTMSDLNRLIADAVSQKRRIVIANHNLHSVYLHHKSNHMQEFFRRADYVHIDGMALIWIARVLGIPLRREHRVTYADWTPVLMREAVRNGWRVFFLGSKPGVPEIAMTRLRSEYAELQIDGRHGYFATATDGPDNRDVVATINTFRPHVLLVGMGMPRQEQWVAANLDRLDVNTVLLAGAAMDYVAGVVPTPSRAASRLGFEWLLRLVAEPRRLWRRYLVEPWSLLGLLARDLIRFRVTRVPSKG